MKEKIEQGITTSIGGNCGISIAPVEKNLMPENDTEIEGFGKKSEVLKRFSIFAKAVKDMPLGSNLATFLGHGALRKAVIGYENRRTVGRYVRERKVVSLHEMIRKCTSMPASVYGLSGKGILREGFDADICIFDADKLIDKADFVNCCERCEGLNYVILNGEVVAENAIYNGKKREELF